MTWLQDTQESLMEKVSQAEDFYSHTLLRRGFKNWLKVCLHHSGETIPSKLAAAALSRHQVPLHTPAAQHLLSYIVPIPATPFPSSETFFQLSTLHHSPPPRTISCILLLHLRTVSSCSLLIFLHSCPHYPSLPQSQHCSVSASWAGGWEKETILTSFSVLLP